MRATLTVILCLLIIPHLPAQPVYTVETIPNPKTEYNGYVSNPDNIIAEWAVNRMNQILKQLEDSSTIQVAVVAVNSIGDEVSEDFRTKLFRHWGIGQKENDNGLLILMVMDQRSIDFEVGYGLEPIMTDAMSKHIQMTKMIPLAKEGKFSECLLAGVEEVDKILSDINYRSEVYAKGIDAEYEKTWWRKDTSSVGIAALVFVYLFSLLFNIRSRKSKLKSAPIYVKHQFNPFYTNSKILLLNIGVPALFIISQLTLGSLRVFEFAIFGYLFFSFLLFEKRIRLNRYIYRENSQHEPQDVYNILAKSHRNGWGAAAVFFPVPFLLYSILNKRRLFSLRNTAPLSTDGSTKMIKLGEVEDDEFLKAYQLKEEQLKSIDYDVWVDPKSDHVKIYSFENFFSKYSHCPSCSAKAYFMTKNQTVRAATYSSTGEGVKTYTCKNCNYTKKESYTIAKLTHSTSSSGSYSGGSSFSGGGSFGGGSSGGGGAGSHW